MRYCFNAKHTKRPISHYLDLSFVKTRVHDNGDYINTTGVTRGAGITDPSGAPEFTPRFLFGFVLLDL